MSNSNYRKGYRFENALVNGFKEKGYEFAARTAGSHSPYDIIAIKGNSLFLIQCKAKDITPGEFMAAKKKMGRIAKELTVVECLAYKKKGKVEIVPIKKSTEEIE